jgi:hypothetical protein
VGGTGVAIGVGVSAAAGDVMAICESPEEGATLGASVTSDSGVAKSVTVRTGVGDGIGVEVRGNGVAVGKAGMGVGMVVMIRSSCSGKVGRGSQEPDGLLPGDGTPEETADTDRQLPLPVVWQ